MLQKPDAKTEKILKLADFIEGLEPERFDMGAWGTYQEPRCICGWLMQLEGFAEKDDWRHASEILGIDEFLGKELFSIHSWNNKKAARILRHLAVTGEYDPLI